MEPRVIETQTQYRRYLDEVARLAAGDPDANTDDGARLELLAKLVEDYEMARFPFAHPDPVEAILFRMEQQGLRQKDIAGLLGGKNRASEILARKRPLTLSMIRALHERLAIPSDLLIREPAATYDVAEDVSETDVRLWLSRVREVASSRAAVHRRFHPENLNEDVLKYVARLSWMDHGPRLARQLKNIGHEVRVWRWSAGAVPTLLVPHGPVALPLPHKPSIAVLPFANMSGDPEQEYFADGIVEDITTGLSRFSSLFVIARNSSFTYKGKTVDVKQVGRELGVRYVLEGSVRKAGDRVRITGQLIEAATGGHVWAERYDGELKDIFTLQEDIARRIVGTIAPEIVLAEQSRIGRMPQQALRAYDLAMQSLSLCRRGEYTHDRTLIEKAFDLANDAHAADPASAPACYALAEALSELAERARLRDDMPALLDKAAAVAEALRDLDPTNHSGYYLIGHAAIRRRRAAEALSNLRRAHELNPNDCRTLQYLAWAEFNLGLSSEAREHAELALRLSPRDPQRYLSHWVIAFAGFVAGSPHDGVGWARKAITENPTFFHGHGILAACLAESGQLEGAQAEIAYLLRHDPVYIRSRLAGDNYFGIPELGARFTSALRKAAGPLLAEIGLCE